MSPRNDRARLCAECELTDACDHGNGRLCVACYLTYLISNEEHAEAVLVAEAEGVSAKTLETMVTREAKHVSMRAAVSAMHSAMRAA